MSGDDHRPDPIDAPALPPWLSRGDLPTSSAPSPGSPQTPDTAPLRGRIPSRGAAPQTPDTVPLRAVRPPPAEDPRAMAQRLAREAKARLRASTPEPVPQAATETPAPAEPEPVPQAAAAETPAPQAEPPVSREPSPKRGSLAARAQRISRPVSAREALKALSTPAPAARRDAPAPGAPAPAKRPPQPEALPPAEIARAVALIARLLPGSQLQGAPQAILDRETFRAVWSAHRASALSSGELPLIATASVLLDATERVPPMKLLVGQVLHQGQSWAFWIDIDRNVLLGLASPGDVYVAGT